MRRLLAILLESAGYRVTAAADGAEALAIVAASPRRFDLLLSDYVMPGLSGLELCNALRARWPDLRVVLMTGPRRDSGRRRRPSCRAARELLGKPFTREQLQRVITGMLAGGLSGAVNAGFEIRDRDEIERWLRRDERAHVYALADLDDVFWSDTRWFACAAARELAAVCLLLEKLALPILYAISPPARRRRCARCSTGCARRLPERVFATLGPRPRGRVRAASSRSTRTASS